MHPVVRLGANKILELLRLSMLTGWRPIEFRLLRCEDAGLSRLQ